MAKKSALGKGLDALIKQSETEKNTVNAINNINVKDITANPFQPRTNFEQEALGELASSIKQLGIIQPVTVREIENGQYQIISGERRYRASLLAGLTEIPAYVRQADDNSMLELALVENIQREDLDAIEIAISYQRLIDECRLTQENVSERIGKKRSTVANYLRLLKLPAEVQLAIRQRILSMGHARALINVEQPEQQMQIFRDIIENGMSVRQVETLVRQMSSPENISSPDTDQETEAVDKPAENEVLIYEDTHLSGETEAEQLVKEKLSKCFGTKVDLKRNESGSGRVVISFRSDDELQYILQIAEKLQELDS
jgi:ParB family chromosome partitioning protein